MMSSIHVAGNFKLKMTTVLNKGHHLYGQVYGWGHSVSSFLKINTRYMYGPVHEVSILIASVRSEGSGESENGRLTRAFAACIHNGWMKMKAQPKI